MGAFKALEDHAHAGKTILEIFSRAWSQELWRSGGESPSLACWHGLLVDWVAEFLVGLDLGLVEGQGPRPAHRTGAWDSTGSTDFQASTPPHG